MTKRVYIFGDGKADGRADMKNLLGGKGANLAEMSHLGLPVPAGFTITTDVCMEYLQHGESFPDGLKQEVTRALTAVEKIMDATFGCSKNPLLLSVRSGARASMPGMMDTVLNLGLNSDTLAGLATKTNNPRFAADSYRRFIQMYADVVMGVDPHHFEGLIDEMKKKHGVKLDTELTTDDLTNLAQAFKRHVAGGAGQDFPDDPMEQLWGGIAAVFRSWNTPRAVTYRKLNGYPSDWGTAVNVQAMVFGNMGDDSATGVAFTRDPSTGEKNFFGEYLVNAQGEDVVAGIRTPQPITIAAKKEESDVTLEEWMPETYKDLESIYHKLEAHYRDMQDIEFTIQQGKLWILQTRSGKRTAAAAVKIAVDMVEEGLLSKPEALLRVKPQDLDQLLHPTIDSAAKRQVMAKGLPASPGAAVGRVVFSAEDAAAWDHRGEKVILVRLETSPDDIQGMIVSQGILTARGGLTSHAAVVARGMGKCCVAGSGDLVIDYKQKLFRAGATTVREGEWITLDGSKGEVMLGKLPTSEPELSGEFGTFMAWADETRTLQVRANADTPADAKRARRFGAEGIGLCRTEHMFFEADRITAVREMIVAQDLEGRKKALQKILPMQRKDFIGIFREMEGLPVTIRLLDPPLHEFLPHTDREIEALAKSIGTSSESLKYKVESLHEMNPMLGHRGCRLGITFPEIYAMQTQAILEAACELAREGLRVIPEIEIPLVGLASEVQILREVCEKVAHEVMERMQQKVDYSVGAMIELPRACVAADSIAAYADFMSFGTNDLTQTTFGFSRDDAGKFLEHYVERHLIPVDPFVTIDRSGVGKLMQLAVDLARAKKPDMEMGICGEHGGDPESVMFCHRLGLNAVSCSPYRVPIARLAAAHAVLKSES